jgi:hypothetical protein
MFESQGRGTLLHFFLLLGLVASLSLSAPAVQGELSIEGAHLGLTFESAQEALGEPTFQEYLSFLGRDNVTIENRTYCEYGKEQFPLLLFDDLKMATEIQGRTLECNGEVLLKTGQNLHDARLALGAPTTTLSNYAVYRKTSCNVWLELNEKATVKEIHLLTGDEPPAIGSPDLMTMPH